MTPPVPPAGAPRACFLDVDGVLVDRDRLFPEWDRLIGDVLAPALGREPAAWGRVNHPVYEREVWPRRDEWGTVPLARFRAEAVMWVHALCRALDVAPPDDDTCDALIRRAGAYVCANHRAAFADTPGVIRALSGRVTLHTATGNASWGVDAFFGAMGLRDRIGVGAGPDLVGVVKDSPEFYPRLFALAGVDPAHAVVVEDGPGQVALARAAGAATVLVTGGAPAAGEADAVIAAIGDLPAALERLRAGEAPR